MLSLCLELLNERSRVFLKIEQVQNKLPVPDPCAFIRNLDILMNFEIWQKKKFYFKASNHSYGTLFKVYIFYNKGFFNKRKLNTLQFLSYIKYACRLEERKTKLIISFVGNVFGSHINLTLIALINLLRKSFISSV